MEPILPSPDEWRELYAAAAEFRAAAPWKWMEEMDIFGVTNPESGEVGYCSIMGAAEEHFALAVYEGKEGLESLLRLEAMGEAAVESMEAALSQKCLMASFEDRQELDTPDLKTIKGLGLKFRGKKAWPLFRRMRPFRVPYFVDAYQARFLTLALRQAVEVARRYQEEPELLGSEENPTFLVRTSKQADAGLEWFDERQEAPDFDEPEPVAPYALSDFEAQKIRRLPLKPLAIEMDFLLIPAPIEDEDGPYFPYLFIMAEPSSKMILGVQTATPWDYGETLGQTLLKAFDGLGARPQEIRVGRPELLELFSEFETRCDIPVSLSEDLASMESLFAELMGHLGFS